MIKVSALHKKFGKLRVLEGFDLEIDRPGIYAVLGPNGSGKTTLIKSILGMVIPDSGEILIDGQVVRSKWRYRDNIDYLPQIAQFPGNLKVTELLKMVADLRDKPANADALIERFDLKPHLDKKLSHLSGGSKQKVNIVLSLMFDSDLLILDEPTTGLDPVALVQLKQILRNARDAGKIILITSHIMSFVEEVAGDIIFLLDGKVYYNGSVEALKAKSGQPNLEEAIATILKEHRV